MKTFKLTMKIAFPCRIDIGSLYTVTDEDICVRDKEIHVTLTLRYRSYFTNTMKT